MQHLLNSAPKPRYSIEVSFSSDEFARIKRLLLFHNPLTKDHGSGLIYIYFQTRSYLKKWDLNVFRYNCNAWGDSENNTRSPASDKVFKHELPKITGSQYLMKWYVKVILENER